MLTETRLHEKRHTRELRKRRTAGPGVTQDRINRHKHKWRLNREDLLRRRDEAQAEAEKAALKQTQRLVAAKQHTKAVEQPGGGLFRKLLNGCAAVPVADQDVIAALEAGSGRLLAKLLTNEDLCNQVMAATAVMALELDGSKAAAVKIGDVEMTGRAMKAKVTMDFTARRTDRAAGPAGLRAAARPHRPGEPPLLRVRARAPGRAEVAAPGDREDGHLRARQGRAVFVAVLRRPRRVHDDRRQLHRAGARGVTSPARAPPLDGQARRQVFRRWAAATSRSRSWRSCT
jgi:hypothetical protein